MGKKTEILDDIARREGDLIFEDKVKLGYSRNILYFIIWLSLLSYIGIKIWEDNLMFHKGFFVFGIIYLIFTFISYFFVLGKKYCLYKDVLIIRKRFKKEKIYIRDIDQIVLLDSETDDNDIIRRNNMSSFFWIETLGRYSIKITLTYDKNNLSHQFGGDTFTLGPFTTKELYLYLQEQHKLLN